MYYLLKKYHGKVNTAKRFFVLLCCFLFLLSGCNAVENVAPIAKNGFIDLSDMDFDEITTHRLDGMWAFYWNKFIEPSEYSAVTPDAYSKVPGIWNETNVGGTDLPGTGFGTYQLHVKSALIEGTQLGLRLFTFSSAYRLYINDKLIAQNGMPGKTAQEEAAEYRPQTVYFEAPDQHFTITVHVSNHVYARGGFWYSAFFGKAEQMAAMQDSIMQREAFLFGALAIVGLFFFVLYLMRTELHYLLVFSCLCIVMLVAISMVGQLTIFHFLPMSFDKLVLVWYSSDAWLFFFVYLFIHMLYKSKLSHTLLWIFLSVKLIQQLIYLFTPVLFYTQHLAIPASIINIIIVAGTIMIIILGIRNKQEGAWLNLCGIVVAAASYVHDDMFWMNMINPHYGELHHFGLFFFLFMQMVVQAKRIRRYFHETMAAELAFCQAQIKPHFLYNSLNTIISTSYFDAEKARVLLIDFAAYLRRSFDFKTQNHMVSLEHEIEFSKAYIRIEQARFEERIRLRYDIEASMTAQVPMLVLQPIIENAIRHGLLPLNSGGEIHVSIKQNSSEIIFCVADNGSGMDEDVIAAVLLGKHAGGIALFNIHKRLKRTYGKGLSIIAAKGQGTRVSWCIPLKIGGKRND